MFPRAPVSAPVEHDWQHHSKLPGPIRQPRGVKLIYQGGEPGPFGNKPAPRVPADYFLGQWVRPGLRGVVGRAWMDEG